MPFITFCGIGRTQSLFLLPMLCAPNYHLPEPLPETPGEGLCTIVLRWVAVSKFSGIEGAAIVMTRDWSFPGSGVGHRHKRSGIWFRECVWSKLQHQMANYTACLNSYHPQWISSCIVFEVPFSCMFLSPVRSSIDIYLRRSHNLLWVARQTVLPLIYLDWLGVC